MGHLVVILGIAVVLSGLLSAFAHKIPFLGKLPGDIRIRKKNFSFYLPLGSSLVISIILSLILHLLTRK